MPAESRFETPVKIALLLVFCSVPVYVAIKSILCMRTAKKEVVMTDKPVPLHPHGVEDPKPNEDVQRKIDPPPHDRADPAEDKQRELRPT